MPRGFEGVREASDRLNNRKNSGFIPFGSRFKFMLSDGQSGVVRFLEEGDNVHYIYAHKIKRPGRSYPDFVPCRDQNEDGENCPACAQDIPKSFRGFINVIWRDAPIYEKDKEGKFLKQDGRYVITGHKDQVAVWEQGIFVFRTLDKKDSIFKGLSSRDFVVTRDGEGLNTTYSIEPSDPDGGRKATSAADKKLAEQKYDLVELTKAPTIEQWNAILGNLDTEDTAEVPQRRDGSPFASKENIFMGG